MARRSIGMSRAHGEAANRMVTWQALIGPYRPFAPRPKLADDWSLSRNPLPGSLPPCHSMDSATWKTDRTLSSFSLTAWYYPEAPLDCTEIYPN